MAVSAPCALLAINTSGQFVLCCDRIYYMALSPQDEYLIVAGIEKVLKDKGVGDAFLAVEIYGVIERVVESIVFERAKQIPVPSQPHELYKIKPSCSECGLVLESIMGYCCPNTRCPTGMGPIVC